MCLNGDQTAQNQHLKTFSSHSESFPVIKSNNSSQKQTACSCLSLNPKLIHPVFQDEKGMDTGTSAKRLQNNRGSGWVTEEQFLLCELFQIYGPRWSEITDSFPGRTSEYVIMHFQSLLRRVVRTSSINDEQKSGVKIRKILKVFDSHSSPQKSVMIESISRSISDMISTCLRQGWRLTHQQKLRKREELKVIMRQIKSIKNKLKKTAITQNTYQGTNPLQQQQEGYQTGSEQIMADQSDFQDQNVKLQVTKNKEKQLPNTEAPSKLRAVQMAEGEVEIRDILEGVGVIQYQEESIVKYGLSASQSIRISEEDYDCSHHAFDNSIFDSHRPTHRS